MKSHLKNAALSVGVFSILISGGISHANAFWFGDRGYPTTPDTPVQPNYGGYYKDGVYIPYKKPQKSGPPLYNSTTCAGLRENSNKGPNGYDVSDWIVSKQYPQCFNPNIQP